MSTSCCETDRCIIMLGGYAFAMSRRPNLVQCSGNRLSASLLKPVAVAWSTNKVKWQSGNTQPAAARTSRESPFARVTALIGAGNSEQREVLALASERIPDTMTAVTKPVLDTLVQNHHLETEK